MPAIDRECAGRIVAAHLDDRCRQKYAHAGIRAFAHQQVDNLLRRSVAEKLAQRLFVIRDAVPLDEPDEIRRRVARQRRFREVRIGREEVVGPRVQVGKVGAASSGDQDLLARPLRALQHSDAASAAAGFDRGHQACRARSEDEDIETVLIHGANFPSFDID